ncbi:hypothetical protein CJF30_00003439 [Rutstroemia sp. NJR-2017a BBW]|nr:hypothetical protein CJF30_00003439 [Rutstroemia sp. NJR-2017a BBW]
MDSTTTSKTTTTTPATSQPKYAYATLVTNHSYLPGALLLAHTLHKHKSLYPLILLHANFPSSDLTLLEREAQQTNTILKPTTLLNISEGFGVAERFKDTWTKLQVFDLWRDGWERVCFLDADMLIFQNMDEVMQFPLQGPESGEQGKRLAATHVCVCNLDHDDWAPADWKKENCAYTGFAHPEALAHPPVVPKTGAGKKTHTLLNGGMFLFEPSEETWNDLWKFVAEHREELRNYQFPDQDLLAEWWRDRWYAVGWKYNALKTWRYWHPDMWRDDQVSCLHYIVDKPWSKRIGADGKAGYLGKDGETHRWWWEEYEIWRGKREDRNEKGILDLMNGLVARPLGEESIEKEEISEKIDGGNEVDSQAIKVR